jgi:regulator of sigma E protease
MSTLIPIFIFLLILGVVVFVHEVGHFLGAKRAGVFVEEFAIGVLSKTLGDTLYSLRLFPIGGFCRMYGHDAVQENKADGAEKLEDARHDSRSLLSKPIWKRITIFASGAVMNALVAFLIIFGLSSFYEQGTITGTIITSVTDGTPSSRAGLLPGDKINSINGEMIVYHGISDIINREMRGNPETPLEIGIIRDGRQLAFSVLPSYSPSSDGSAGSYRIGVMTSAEIRVEKVGLLSRLPEGGGISRAGFGETLRTSARDCVLMVSTIYRFLGELFTRRASADDMMGPIGLVHFMGNVYEQTIAVGAMETLTYMLWIMALISINLAVINFLPLPALDGGRIVFLLIEGIRRKPINPEKEGMINLAGFVLLMVLVVYLAFNDIRNIL